MVLEDGKFYPMMKVVRGEEGLNQSVNTPECIQQRVRVGEISSFEISMLFDEYGEHLLKEKHPVLLQFLKKEKELYEGILEKLLNQDSAKSEARQKEIKEKLKYINLGLEWFEYEM